MASPNFPYPQPGPVGGRLIREGIAAIRRQGVTLPLTSHILIAVSGGCDSVALAHLLLKYGRRVVAPGQIELLHINHGWRGADSDEDARFVERLGQKWGVGVQVHSLNNLDETEASGGPSKRSQPSWEEVARQSRKKIFERQAARQNSLVLTAHHADDLAETLLWRLFTGAAKTHGGGIAFRNGVELRPFLTLRKESLQAYLREEGQVWREDSTNHSGRFMRSRMRLDLLPAIERLFPRAVDHLAKLALQAQAQVGALRSDNATSQIHSSNIPPGEIDLLPFSTIFEAAGLKVRRPHWEALKVRLHQTESSKLHLPGGWTLTHHPKSRVRPGRWVLEESQPSA